MNEFIRQIEIQDAGRYGMVLDLLVASHRADADGIKSIHRKLQQAGLD